MTTKILINLEDEITKHILYLYSMESFIYPELNRASRDKDTSKIKYYGAFAASLSYIIYSANKNRTNDMLAGATELYRGLTLTEEEIDQYVPSEKLHLLGYISTSKQFKVAERFAVKYLK